MTKESLCRYMNMIDKEKRKAEIKTIILGCVEGNQDWPDDMADAIITQEQSMIDKLEADKAELLEALKEIYEDIDGDYVAIKTLCNNLIQKMEK
jgi:hypothetical protein